MAAKKKPAKTDDKGREGRDASGRFAKGYKGGPGNPHFRKIAEYRRAISEAVTPDQVAQVVDRMRLIAQGEAVRIVQDEEGQRETAPAFSDQIAAAKVWLERVIGKPKESPESIDLPEIGGVQDLPRVALRALEALATGQINAGEAQAIAGAAREYREAVAVAELMERVAKLEAKDG